MAEPKLVITRELATKVLKVVDAGLVAGVGVAEPGKMCVEAAVCYALGEPHGDNPSCVGSAVRAFKIRLNDSHRWPSIAARAAGMRELAIAQLGSDKLDQREFATRLAIATVREILSRVLWEKNRELAQECQAVKTLKEAQVVAQKAKKYAYADAAAYAAAYADAAAYAVAATYAAADAAYAAYAADAADALSVLIFAARMATQILVDMGSPGTEFLDLIQA